MAIGSKSDWKGNTDWICAITCTNSGIMSWEIRQLCDGQTSALATGHVSLVLVEVQHLVGVGGQGCRAVVVRVGVLHAVVAAVMDARVYA
jgi:hypothetical protein